MWPDVPCNMKEFYPLFFVIVFRYILNCIVCFKVEVHKLNRKGTMHFFQDEKFIFSLHRFFIVIHEPLQSIPQHVL